MTSYRYFILTVQPIEENLPMPSLFASIFRMDRGEGDKAIRVHTSEKSGELASADRGDNQTMTPLQSPLLELIVE